MGQPSQFFEHSDCGCQGREPLKGSRYRWRSRDPLTGEDRGWRYLTVEAVEPLRHDRILCRRVVVRSDDGRVWHPQISDFGAKYQAVGNVLTLNSKGET